VDYDQVVAKIGKLENGYTVCVIDEDQAAKNRDPKSKTPWKDPWKEYAFTTAAEVETFLHAHLDKLEPPPDADTEFATAFAKDAASDD
jgi:hypothetical protein